LKERLGDIILNIMKPIYIEVVTNLLTVFNHCNRCGLIFAESGFEDKVNKEALAEYPKDLREELCQLSDWIQEVIRLYKHRIRIRIIDAKSLSGIYKSLRYRFRKYPAFIVNREDVMAGWDREKLYDILDAHIQRARV
jgi:hypothetical protein